MIHARLRAGLKYSLFSLAVLPAVVACSDDGNTTSGGTGGFDPTATGGAGAALSGTGGTVGSGGAVTGGMPGVGGGLGGASPTGGAATGGASPMGGAVTGGALPTGGATPVGGGSPTGGVATGGAATGGVGAASTGGAGAGGSGAGGSGTGGEPTGGNPGTGGGTVIPDGGYPENTGAGCDVSAAQTGANNPNLPDPFAMHDGTRISTMAEWPCRRNEIKKDIEALEIGTKPEPPEVTASVNGNSLQVVVTTSSGSITLSSNIGNGSDCVMIAMGFGGLSSSCVGLTFNTDQVMSYANGSGSFDGGDPFFTVYPQAWQGNTSTVAKYAAWAWGVSRLIDGLEQVQDQLGIDMSRIGVQGCSYAGKMALFSGAFDERVALTIAQESGGGGINSWRTSQDFVDRTGTNIEKIDNTNYSWFLPSMQRLNPYTLPHDHHELIAMIAPRAVIALGNRDYEWLGDESGFKSINAAMEVWKAMGLEDHIGYDFTTGHSHCQAAQSQVQSAGAFISRFLEGGSDDTLIRVDPPSNGFDLDWTNVVDWATPTLQ